MATILLSAAGAAIGGSIGGSVAGLSSVAIGRAVGATLGQVIDQRILGQGSQSVETGRVERFRLSQAGDGNPIGQVFGRVRVGGQVIWASDFRESSTTTGGGGKGGGPSEPTVTSYSYSVSLAIAVCEGQIQSISRVWADGEEVAKSELNLRVYTGTRDQLPDPVIEAIEGAGQVPAYRGTAYVVLEDVQLGRFGNRVPQFSFEVIRDEQPDSPAHENSLANLIKGVALMPGSGEYTLATNPVFLTNGPGSSWPANTNSPSGKTDFETAIDALTEEIPGCESASLIVSWFGNDLRCDSCEVVPKIEKSEVEGSNMPWQVSGVRRTNASETIRKDGRPIYGGTPSDAAVVQAIRHMTALGKRVMFYPFILMDQTEGNQLPDPWTGDIGQPNLPWRGRISLSTAPGRDGSPDQSEGAATEVAKFFGTVRAADFSIGNGTVSYAGPEEWGLNRFILHYAALCVAAGGVSSFCISSEMRGLTQIRGASGFPAVEALRTLAAEARTLLGPDTKIGYAADWSEYFGYQPADGSGDRYFHLDSLWADENIDFVGIDNYMPLSDWREGEDHADGAWKSIYNPEYLSANIEGGEGFDWYYASPEASEAQIRTPIVDAQHNEHWIWRNKDLRNWWQNEHHERVGGIRQPNPTPWVPQSKPIWFTELGCAAVDKGTNQPNKFLDPKSSESSLPSYSNGLRDDFLQHQYLSTVLGYWKDDEKNPVSDVYGESMIDMSNAHVWAWDARPYPVFPNNQGLWSDGANYSRGHWINGRIGARTLASVVEEICRRSGVTSIDTSKLFGIVRGYTLSQVTDARSALQPLMLRYGFDAVERDGVLRFVIRDGGSAQEVTLDAIADCDEIEGVLDHRREAEAELSGRVRVKFVQSGADHEVVAEEVVLADTATHAVSSSELPLSMTRAEGRQVVERWLTEARVSRDTVRFALPPSKMLLGAGEVVKLPSVEGSADALFRIDKVEQSDLQILEAVRIESSVYSPSEMPDDVISVQEFVAPSPVLPLFMDVPLMSGDEIPHAPHIAVSSKLWPGSVALFESATDQDYALSNIIDQRAVIGLTESPMSAAVPGVWDQGAALRVKLLSGALESKGIDAILNGANLAAIGDGTSENWEMLQFRDADLIEEDTYLLSGRLRGQLGSDALMPDVWPSGSWFVLMNQAPVQINLPSSHRRIAKHYRIGPARRSYDDPSYVHSLQSFNGCGLRPYSPCHLAAIRTPSGDVDVSWIRRTRTEGDSWDLSEVPLGEEIEAYLVRVWHGMNLVRETTVQATQWTYSATLQAVDELVLPVRIEVGQISARYGVGLSSSVVVKP